MDNNSSWNPTRRNCEQSLHYPSTESLLTLDVSRHQISTPSFTFNPNNKFRRDYPPRSFAPPPVTMNPNEMPMKAEPVGLGMWSSPTPQTVTRPRPATIHESGFSYCMPEEYTALPAWDSSTMPMQQLHDGLPQTYTVNQDFYPPSSGERECPCCYGKI